MLNLLANNFFFKIPPYFLLSLSIFLSMVLKIRLEDQKIEKKKKKKRVIPV